MARTKLQVQQDRNNISKLMAKSVTNPSDIASLLKMPLPQVKNDLYSMRKNSRQWLAGYAAEGYRHVTKLTIEQLEDIEVELQKMRQDLTPAKEQPPTTNPSEVDARLKVLKELRETINTRWIIQGNGPTLMHLQALQDEALASKGTERS